MGWVSADVAMRRLNIRQQTLYAYVSRGRLEARPDPADPRRSLYSAEQIERLAARGPGPRKASDIASDTIAWGEPVLASVLTTIARDRLWYRGQDAIKLSERATLEETAALFWDTEYAPSGRPRARARGSMLERLYLALANLAATSEPARGRALSALAGEAAMTLETLVDAAAGPSAALPIHVRLSKAWGLNPRGSQLLRRALVLLVDHELNASTFAARVAASTGASLPASALAGFATLSGPLHGAAIHTVAEFIDACERAGARASIRARLSDSRRVPGFGHPLYPKGDPRAAALLEDLPASKSLAPLRALVEAETGERPNVDFAIAALARAYDIPADGAFAIFAVGRCVGWLGHAMEQLQSGHLIRPRARYVGPEPK